MTRPVFFGGWESHYCNYRDAVRQCGDGVLIMLWNKSLPFFGVQWHSDQLFGGFQRMVPQMADSCYNFFC